MNIRGLYVGVLVGVSVIGGSGASQAGVTVASSQPGLMTIPVVFSAADLIAQLGLLADLLQELNEKKEDYTVIQKHMHEAVGHVRVLKRLGLSFDERRQMNALVARILTSFEQREQITGVDDAPEFHLVARHVLHRHPLAAAYNELARVLHRQLIPYTHLIVGEPWDHGKHFLRTEEGGMFEKKSFDLGLPVNKNMVTGILYGRGVPKEGSGSEAVYEKTVQLVSTDYLNKEFVSDMREMDSEGCTTCIHYPWKTFSMHNRLGRGAIEMLRDPHTCSIITMYPIFSYVELGPEPELTVAPIEREWHDQSIRMSRSEVVKMAYDLIVPSKVARKKQKQHTRVSQKTVPGATQVIATQPGSTQQVPIPMPVAQTPQEPALRYILPHENAVIVDLAQALHATHRSDIARGIYVKIPLSAFDELGVPGAAALVLAKVPSAARTLGLGNCDK